MSVAASFSVNIESLDYNTFVKSMPLRVFTCHSEERSDEESRDAIKLRFFAEFILSADSSVALLLQNDINEGLRMTIMEVCLEGR